MATLNASVSSRKPVIVIKKSNQLWMHVWFGGAIYDSRRLATPSAEVEVNWPLFTEIYIPKDGDIVLDLGAGIGTELVKFSRAVGKSGRVIAVDASSECTRMMRSLVNLKQLNNVEVLELAVGGEIGMVSFAQSGTDLTARVTNENTGITVEMVTIDWILKSLEIEVADFIKLNIEGAEFEALKKLDKSKFRRIVVSCHDFMGERELETFDSVISWAKDNDLIVEQLQDAIPGSCEAFYLYLSNPDLT